MSDTPPSLDAILDAAEAAEPAPAAAEPAPEAAPEPAAAEPTSTEPTEAEVQSWLDSIDPRAAKEIRDLRKQAQNYREKYVPFRDAFDGLDDGSRDFLLDFTRGIRDPERRAEVAQQMLEELQAIVQPDDPAPVSDDQPYLTKADLERELAVREQQRLQEEAVAGITTQAESLGYKRDTREYVSLLWEAANNHNNDITAAHKALEAERKQVIEKYLAEKAGAADNSVDPAPPMGAAPSGEKQIKSLADAKNALEGFLDEQYGPRR